MNTKEKVVASSTNAKTRPGLVIANHNVEKLRQGVEKESVKVSGRHEKRLAAGKGKEKAGESASKNYAADGKRNIPNSLPQFRGIDERAEDFINKFRQSMKLEREQSLLDFQEMLKRSA
ncbi:cotton fiber protein [Acinetobacter baumannii]